MLLEVCDTVMVKSTSSPKWVHLVFKGECKSTIYPLHKDHKVANLRYRTKNMKKLSCSADIPISKEPRIKLSSWFAKNVTDICNTNFFSGNKSGLSSFFAMGFLSCSPTWIYTPTILGPRRKYLRREHHRVRTLPRKTQN